MKRLIVVAIPCILLFSCQKDYDRNNGATTYRNLNEALASEAPQPKIITLNAAIGGTFRGNSGTRYSFPANGFVTKDGSTVTGEVQVVVTEYLTKSDMLFSRILPLSEDGPLISGGEASVNASQNGVELQMASSKKYDAKLPQSATPVAGMSLFIGEPDPVTNLVTWRKSNDTAGSISYNGDSIGINTNQFNFINADKFYNNPNVTTISVKVLYNGTSVSDSFAVFTMFDNQNTVLVLDSLEQGTVVNTTVARVPMHLVALGMMDNQLCSGIIAINPTAGSSYTISVSKTTPSKLKNEIDKL